jgi:hypothetical protein
MLVIIISSLQLSTRYFTLDSEKKATVSFDFLFIPSTNMSGSCVIHLLHDYDVKEVKLLTFKLKCDDITKKETFDVKKSDGTTIEI